MKYESFVRRAPLSLKPDNLVRVVLRLLTVFVFMSVPILASAPASDGFCDDHFVGGLFSPDSAQISTIEGLALSINQRFGVNFIVDPQVAKLPVVIKAGSLPWNVLLRAQLGISGVRANCVAPNTIQLVKAPDTSGEAGLMTRVIKLRYIRPTTREHVDIAGQRAPGGSNTDTLSGCGAISDNDKPPPRCGRYERLVLQIRKILNIPTQNAADADADGGGGGDDSKTAPTAGSVSVPNRRMLLTVPSRSYLLIRAPQEELQLIDKLVELVDQPPFQVVVKGLVYTANQSHSSDIGLQTSIKDNSANRVTGSITGHTKGSGGTLFDFKSIVGTVEFQVQATALEKAGIISIKSRPFSTVLDGERTDLVVGKQIPIILQSVNTLGGQPGSLEILQAGNLISVTPNVIVNKNDEPVSVNLEVQLEANEPFVASDDDGGGGSDNANIGPTVIARSIQTRLILNTDQTVILGGFTLDSHRREVSKTPLLGNIPILGELFKRRVKATDFERLYFAISVSVLPYSEKPEPVVVPDLTTQPPSITPDMEKRERKNKPKEAVESTPTGQ
ncbi:MAG: hypothetical protein DCC44_02110 [Acidobacteria bacterium]|nr:hypothetical protein [Pyrinomonadaceae bacterium]RIJ95570.1 MAG: hypothetical protein DCC44_02110 [Acidobacteriota bacterium]